MAATMIAGIVSSLGAPLLPEVARTMHVSLSSAQWSLTVALLAGAISAPTLGRLGDGRYRREAIIGELIIVFIGSVIAGFANSLPVLIVGRVMQGSGIGLAPITMAAARAHLPADRSRQVIAMLSVIGAAGAGLAYPISGLLATAVSLRAAFFFGGVLSGAILLLAIVAIPSSRHGEAVSLDVRGVITIAAGLVPLLLGIAQGQAWGWWSGRTIAAFALAALILGFWVLTQLRGERPLVDLRQLRHRPVLVANAAALTLAVSLYVFITAITEFIQAPSSAGYGFGVSTLVAGLVLVPFSVIGLLASRLAARVVASLGANNVLVVGSLLTAAVGAFFGVAHNALWEAFVAMGILGLAFGFSFAAIPGMVTRAVPGRETGSALGLYQVIRAVGFSIGSALTASILAASIGDSSVLPTAHGYVLALWVGSGVAMAAALVTLVLGRGAKLPIHIALAHPFDEPSNQPGV
jgi:MFS family permease